MTFKGENGPWFVSLIKQIGVYAFITLAAFYFLTEIVVTDLNARRDEHIQIVNELKQNGVVGASLVESVRVLVILQRAICVNAAKTPADIQRCLEQ